MSVLPISTDAIEPYVEVEKHQAGPLLQAIFEILAEGTIVFSWQKDPGKVQTSEEPGTVNTAPACRKVDLCC
jgi:hypothetical protein